MFPARVLYPTNQDAAKVCTFEQTGAAQSRQNTGNSMLAVFRHTEIAGTEGRPGKHFGRIVRVLYGNADFRNKVAMNKDGQCNPPAEPDRKLVECAVVELLKIAQSQGISVVDFIQIVDSGMRISDFLNAVGGCTNADHDLDYC
jgi:hypothetical protein